MKRLLGMALAGALLAALAAVEGGCASSSGQVPNPTYEAGVHGDPHFIVTDADLVAKHAPRWVLSENWPPPRRSSGSGLKCP